MSAKNIDEWKIIADALYKALRRTSYNECGELNHSGGLYHEHYEPCPVVKLIEDAMSQYEKKKSEK